MMKMDITKIFFRFSGLSFCLVLLSLGHEVHSEETINVASLCDKFNGTVDLRERQQAILHYEEYGQMECEILLSYRFFQYVVISLYEWDLKENDKLVFRDGYTEVSLSGKSQRDEEKSFIFRGQTTILFSTNDTFSSIPNNKFTLSYTASKTGYPKCKKSDFVCNNKMCLNNYNLICDGKNNCGDWSDEIDCDKKCSNNEFECANRKCIPKHKLCNDRNDCGDMSDEEKCNRYCILNLEYKCNNSMCISSDEVCDNKNDCGDWSDEINCHRECDSRQFPCINRKCIDNWKVCNGFDDCGDNSDERKCRSCSSLEFKCSNRLCISNNLVCNNRNDCGDNSDERDCRSCSSLEFKCSNRLCISKNLVCNNRNDCGDNSDERDCSLMENRNLDKQKRPLNVGVILGSVIAGGVFIVLLTLSICYCVLAAKRSKEQNNTAATPDQEPAPSSLMGRLRQSFRSHGQPSAPPLEMDTSGESAPHEWQRAPTLMGRIRQSFRSRHQPTAPPPNAIPLSDVRPENPDRPAIYPNLPAGVDNPEFKSGK